MEKKNKKVIPIKRVLIIIAAVLILLIAAVNAVSYYLLYFALYRNEDPDATPQPAYRINEEAIHTIEENTKRLKTLTDQWYSSSDVTKESVTANDGITLSGDMIRTRGSSKWVILMHGYRRDRTRTYNYGRFYSEKGYNILMPDMRGHSGSGGEWIGMGWLDREDIKKWTDLIISRDEEAQIVLHGVSMGAAAAMMTAGEKLPENVAAVVEDCGYTSVHDIFSDVIRDYAHISDFPFLQLSSAFAQAKAGYSFSEASALDAVKRTSVPVLFIHGDCDTFVHTDMVYRLYESCGSEKELYIARDAAHGQAMYIDPEGYFDTVFAFLEKYVQ